MGRITVFSSEDQHSEIVKRALIDRYIPFIEISLVQHPSRFEKLLALTGQASVPQVFFNARHVGGVRATLEELKSWDQCSKKFANPYDRYQKLIETASDPVHPVLEIPEWQHDLLPTLANKEFFHEPIPINLPDGTSTSVRDITERLKNSIPSSDVKRNKVVYKISFTGVTAMSSFKQGLGLLKDEAAEFGQHLLDERIFQCLSSPGPLGEFSPSDKAVYRLQCFMRPDVLNSFKIMKEPSNRNHMQVFDRLDYLMRVIESDNIMDSGKLNHAGALAHHKFNEFEDVACELQTVKVGDLKLKERLVFGINLYRLMMKYALIKHGPPASQAARHALVSKVKFTVDSKVYSFDQFVTDFVQPKHIGRKKSMRRSLFAQGSNEDKIDPRIHFALNVGAHAGSSASLPFRLFTVENLEKQLDTAAQVFLEDEKNLKFDINNKRVYLSNVIRWNRKDFASPDSNLFIQLSKFLEGTQKQEMQLCIATQLMYTEVDYTCNACKYAVFHDVQVNTDVKGFRAAFFRFRPPPMPDNEKRRLAALRGLAILDTMPEQRFDRITHMARVAFDIPIVVISLVDTNRQWFKSTQWACPGTAPSETGRDISFCGHAILGLPRQTMWIENTLEDDRFADNPLVTGALGVRFYAGCPLSVLDANGDLVNVGTLCMIDFKPRAFDETAVMRLRSFARQVEDEFSWMPLNTSKKPLVAPMPEQAPPNKNVKTLEN